MDISNEHVYLERLSKPLKEKLKIYRFIPENARNVLDVGCADGAVTQALANLFPNIKFLGIDLNEHFIEKAKAGGKNLKNLSFEKVYLRELLAREQKYDAVIFCSVLHEFYTYGEGISSVLKALADAHELLNEGGDIIIRDMILHEYTKKADFECELMSSTIYAKKDLVKYYTDFEKIHGKLDTHYKVNHFLLKYFYTENWEREVLENYLPVTFEQYEKIFELLGMNTQEKQSYLIEYLKNKWIEDFNFTSENISSYKSTGILIARK